MTENTKIPRIRHHQTLPNTRDDALRQAALLPVLEFLGDEAAIKAHVVRVLWRDGRRCEAHALLSLFRTGHFSKVCDAYGDGLVTCRQGMRSRGQIAANVFLRWSGGHGDLMRAYRATARFYGIAQRIARNCFGEYRQVMQDFDHDFCP